MKKLIAAVLMAASLAATPALAGPGHHGGPGPGWSAPAPGHWGGGGHFRHHHHGHWGWAWPIGFGVATLATVSLLNMGRATTQYVDVSATQPSYVPPPAPPAVAPVAPAGNVDYFYCPASNGYYPTVPRCPTGWIKLSPQ